MKLLFTNDSITPYELKLLKELAVTKGLVYVGKEIVIGSDGVKVEKDVKNYHRISLY